MLQDSRTGKDFLDTAPKTQEIKAKLDKCNYIKLRLQSKGSHQERGDSQGGRAGSKYKLRTWQP